MDSLLSHTTSETSRTSTASRSAAADPIPRPGNKPTRRRHRRPTISEEDTEEEEIIINVKQQAKTSDYAIQESDSEPDDVSVDPRRRPPYREPEPRQKPSPTKSTTSSNTKHRRSSKPIVDPERDGSPERGKVRGARARPPRSEMQPRRHTVQGIKTAEMVPHAPTPPPDGPFAEPPPPPPQMSMPMPRGMPSHASHAAPRMHRSVPMRAPGPPPAAGQPIPLQRGMRGYTEPTMRSPLGEWGY